jgi:hypothetical protein
MDEKTAGVFAFFHRQGFLPLDKEGWRIFKNYEYGISVQEMSATLNAIWASAWNICYKVIRGFLCTLYCFDSYPVFFEIHRSGPEPELRLLIDELYDLAILGGLPFLQIRSVEEPLLPRYNGLSGYTKEITYGEEGSEYEYRTADILDLSGGVNLNKRTRLKKFLNNSRISLYPLTWDGLAACLTIEEEWCRGRDCVQCASYTGCEKKAFEIMTDLFDESTFQGMLLYVDDKPAAYSIWERINATVAFVYFAKGIIPNIIVYLYYSMVKTYLSGVEYINVNEDMGKEGLRTFKRHLSAYELKRKYICTLRREGG